MKNNGAILDLKNAGWSRQFYGFILQYSTELSDLPSLEARRAFINQQMRADFHATIHYSVTGPMFIEFDHKHYLDLFLLRWSNVSD